MIEGVTILNIYQEYLGMNLLLLIICIIMAFEDEFKKVLIALGLVAIACFTIPWLHETPVYQVTIEESGRWDKIVEQYDIVKVRGKILDIVEKKNAK